MNGADPTATCTDVSFDLSTLLVWVAPDGVNNVIKPTHGSAFERKELFEENKGVC